MRMVITDLDGTLAQTGAKFGRTDLKTLENLGKAGILRAVATGRTLVGAQHVIAEDFPIDYLLFSSGAGIRDWKTGELLQSHNLPGEAIPKVLSAVLQRNVDFFLHEAIPGNHRFYYHATGKANPDFHLRLKRHGDLGTPLGTRAPKEASQFLVVDPTSHSGELFEEILREFPELRVIRATSPLDHKSAWIEIFSLHVSKSLAAEWLAGHCGISREQIMAVGNDYNDVDLLEWAGAAYVVENSPDALKERFTVVASNNHSGFTEAVRHAGCIPSGG